MKKRKYTTIFWEDHHSDGSWMTKKEIEKWVNKPVICTSTGEITFEDKNKIVLSASYDGSGGWGENICILKNNIVK